MRACGHDGLVIMGCAFSGNEAWRGGAVSTGDLIVKDSVFDQNKASGFGGAIECTDADLALISGCEFTNNEALGSGGGLSLNGETILLTDCHFSGNQAEFRGGAIDYLSAHSELSGCVFEHNDAQAGGAVSLREARLTATDCAFRENTATENGGAISFRETFLTATGCTFRGNTAVDNGGGIFGEFSRQRNSQSQIENCAFDGNSAGGSGGGIYNWDGDAFPHPNDLSTDLTVAECTFTNNSADASGGGMYLAGMIAADVINCTFEDNSASAFDNNVEGYGGGLYYRGGSMAATGCRFLRNSAHHGGGATAYARPHLFTNCVFRDNVARESGGGMVSGATVSNVVGCAFHGNTSLKWASAIRVDYGSLQVAGTTFGGNAARDQLYGRSISLDDHNSNLWLTNSVLWGESPKAVRDRPMHVRNSILQGGVPDRGIDEGGNIFTDPLYVRSPDDGGDGWFDNPFTPDVDEGANNDTGDIHLRRGSPAIDAGNNEFVPADITTDLDGNPRFVDDPAAPDTGVGDAPIVDMGAYEFQVDCDGNGLDDEEEIAADPALDCDANGKLDACEEDRDQDGDGVIDDCDECPGSSVGETIVINECETRVVNQVFDDGCTMADELAACGEEVRNHGAYVSCVARAANSWRRDGTISHDEHGRVVSCAAKQHTGRNLRAATHVKNEPDPPK